MSNDFYIGVMLGMVFTIVMGIVFLLYDAEDENNKRRKP